MTAVRAALRRAIPGDLVVCCVDDAIGGLPRGDVGGRDEPRRDGLRGSGRAGSAGRLTGRRRAWLHRGSCACAGWTCCSPTGRSRPRPCGRSSRPDWRSTPSRGRHGSASCRSGWRTSRRASCRRRPVLGAFPELNVRTYVTRRGRRGVWFLSLDAASRRRGRGRAGRLPPALLPGADVVGHRGRLGRVPLGAGGRAGSRGDVRGPLPAGRSDRSGGAGLAGRVPHGSARPVRRRSGPGGCRGPRSGTRRGRSSRPRPRSGSTRWPRPTASRCRPCRRCSISRSGSTSSPGGRNGAEAGGWQRIRCGADTHHRRHSVPRYLERGEASRLR